MTTAHRPTWAPAKGGEEQGGNRMYVPSRMTSAKDQPGQLTLKFRQGGQASTGDILKRDLRISMLISIAVRMVLMACWEGISWLIHRRLQHATLWKAMSSVSATGVRLAGASSGQCDDVFPAAVCLPLAAAA
ncbi:hypothetical protein WJX74_010495 [Apatococcus lobatus]|uniref:Uncharacterized protein n=1 Tax=Apatococcus lobatus TaxID=904363 RepID=A0AAW1QLE6_9CHLO